jgi:hypothetical protein
MFVRAVQVVMIIVIGGWAVAPPLTVQAAESPLEITELLPDPAAPHTDANDEFLELHNPGATAVSLAGYTVKFGPNLGSTHSLAAATIPAGGYLTITSGATNLALGNAGSSVALYNPAKVQLGATVTYSSAKPGAAWAKSSDGTWSWTTLPTPGAINERTPSPAGSTNSEAEAAGEIPLLQFTELLPDPASPQSDAADEFIEIYNASGEPVNLAGYIIKTGASLSTKHSLKSGIAPPFGYVSLTSATTKIALSNAGSNIALFTPTGQQVGPTINFPKAKTGAAWALDDNRWTWTSTPTPASANLITEPAVQGAATAAKAAKASKTTKAASAASTKTKSTTTKAPKAAKVAKTTGGPTTVAEAATSPGAQWLLFALVGLTIAYCLYEFRYDLQRFYHRLRGHQAPGRPAEPAA